MKPDHEFKNDTNSLCPTWVQIHQKNVCLPPKSEISAGVLLTVPIPASQKLQKITQTYTHKRPRKNNILNIDFLFKRSRGEAEGNDREGEGDSNKIQIRQKEDREMHSLDFVSVLIHIPSTKTYSGCELCSSSLSFHPSVAFASRSRLSKCQPAARSRMATAPNLATGLQRWPEEAAERAYQAPCSRSLSRILSAVVS